MTRSADSSRVGNTMADHHRASGHTVTPGVTRSRCTCGHEWAHSTEWLNKYREQLRPIDPDEHA